MIDLRRPIAELAAEVVAGTVTATQLVQASLDRIEATEEFHALLEVSEAAIERARQTDERIKKGEKVGPLAGIPFVAKDNFLTTGTHTTAGSHILEPFRAPYQAVAIERLEAAGAILVAKANLDAFGHGGSTENSDFGPTKNPHDPDYVPGGSSGGSAASVALGQVCFALGTDTGGSSRLPASYSGVVGFKPTYGLIPRTGVVAMASSTDTIGIFARRTKDVASVLNVLAGRDVSDATSIERDGHSYQAAGAKVDLKGVRIGLIRQHLGEGVASPIKTAVKELAERLEGAGANIIEYDLPAVELSLAAYYILVPAEISSNLARYDGIRYGHSSPHARDLESTYRLSREEGFGAEAKRRILIGTYVLSSGYYDAYYKRAQRVRTKLIEEFNDAFEKVDFLIGPTGPTPAFKLGVNAHDPLAMYLNDVCTVAANLVGVPALSVPLGTVGKLPFGLQVMAPQRAEGKLLAAAAAIEELVL